MSERERESESESERERDLLHPHIPDNPVTTPAVDTTKCMVKSTNVQFQYETEKELELKLQQDYGNVSGRKKEKSN